MSGIIVIIILIIAIYAYKAYTSTSSLPASNKNKPIQSSNISLLPEQFIIVDIETTGLDPEKHEIIASCAE